MENSFQTSFIPKKPIISNNNSGIVDGTSSISIPIVFSFSLVLIVSLIAGGLFIYKGYLDKNREDLHTQLLKIRASFDKDTIAELELFDKRTSASKKILENHIVLSPLFELLNKLTLTSIQYTTFQHSTVNNIFSVKLTGIARDYKSIALQADVFNTTEGAMFKNVIFSDLTKDKNNYVTFSLSFDVDKALLSYSNNIVNKISEPVGNTNSPAVPTTPSNTPTNAVTPSTNVTNPTVSAAPSNPSLPPTNTTP